MNWERPKQTYMVEHGQVGDCWRCCIAAILQVPADTVPHFLLDSQADGYCSCDSSTQRWLNERGYCLVSTRNVSFPRMSGGSFNGLPVIACGPTERSRGLGRHHAVVMVANQTVYDPHPSNAGLTAVMDVYLVVPLLPDLLETNCRCGGLCPACAAQRRN